MWRTRLTTAELMDFWSSTQPKDSHWVNDWKPYLPQPEEEMATWSAIGLFVGTSREAAGQRYGHKVG